MIQYFYLVLHYFRHRNSFFSSVASDDKDRHGLRIEEVKINGLPLSSFNTMLASMAEEK